MTAIFWLLLGGSVGFILGVLVGYVVADRRLRSVPMLPTPPCLHHPHDDHGSHDD